METTLIVVAAIAAWVTIGFIGFLINTRFAKYDTNILPMCLWMVFSLSMPLLMILAIVEESRFVGRIEREIIRKVRRRK